MVRRVFLRAVSEGRGHDRDNRLWTCSESHKASETKSKRAEKEENPSGSAAAGRKCKRKPAECEKEKELVTKTSAHKVHHVLSCAAVRLTTAPESEGAGFQRSSIACFGTAPGCRCCTSFADPRAPTTCATSVLPTSSTNYPPPSSRTSRSATDELYSPKRREAFLRARKARLG